MRPTLAPVLGAIVAAIAPLSCYSDPTHMPETAPCPARNADNPYAPLSLGPNADGIAFSHFWPASYRAPKEAQPMPSGVVGVPCGQARDRDQCLTRVAAARGVEDGWRYSGHVALPEIGVVTRGDDVWVITKPEELSALVAPIESLAEAAVVAAIGGRSVDCSDPNARTEGDGFVLRGVYGGCETAVVEKLFKVHRDGTITDLAENEIDGSTWGCATGRRPIDYATPARPWLASLPAYIAEIAHLEAAAVIAFEELRDELSAHGAPASLVARVERARRDEVAHARIMTAHAKGLGSTPPRVPRATSSRRSLLALAIDNATEGCVREAYGALLATHQAVHASDAALRRAFVRIAREEAEHAALSLDLAAWYAANLTRPERAVVAEAASAAWRELARSCGADAPCAEVVLAAGLPSASTSLAMVAALHASLAA